MKGYVNFGIYEYVNFSGKNFSSPFLSFVILYCQNICLNSKDEMKENSVKSKRRKKDYEKR